MAALPPPPRKHLGQHFLIDPNIVRKIIALARLRPDETVLEIGAGRGILTRALAGEARAVLAIEVDPKLHAYLAEMLGDCANVNLRLGDALTFDYREVPPRTVVVANLPYNVSTPLLVKLLDSRARFDRLILMLQTEVARRLAAPPGTSEYGSLSVLTQHAAEVSLAFQVSPSCFRPRPEVGSAVVSLVPRWELPWGDRDEVAFSRLVRAAFAHRRKTIANSLRDEGLQPDRIAAALTAAGVAPGRRAETVTVAEFRTLAQALARAERDIPASL